jgi:subtilisin family serine protease
MKTIFLYILFLLTLSNISFSQTKDISGYKTKYLNWQNKKTEVTKTYQELIKDKAPKKEIIVAVIDGGIDPNHEDLKSVMWVNKNEIAGNGIDDDNNGYIDDIYGWNFLGNAKGKNINDETLESTRLLRDLIQKYKDNPEENIENKSEYKLYVKLKNEYDSIRKLYAPQYKDIAEAKLGLDFIYQTLETITDKKLNSIEDVKAIESGTEKVNELKNTLIKADKKGLSREVINDYYKEINSLYNANYNLSFNPRKQVIGDDITDITDNNYGNPDIKGEDAFHGTFCAGLIGAIQDNKIGINGIASKVKIMGLRAVPNGDEYDKDIALSIRYAVDNGAQIINMSFGKDYSPQKNLVDDAFRYAEEHGVLLIQAAGNDAKNINLGYNFPTDSLNSGTFSTNLITVGASTIHHNKRLLASFSNYGNHYVDLFAPGQDIVSLAPNNQYDQADGTSFAAPVVTGIAALIWSYYPELTYTQLKNILLGSVTDYSNKKVKMPSKTRRRKRKKVKELAVSGGVVNVYNAFVLAEELSK